MLFFIWYNQIFITMMMIGVDTHIHTCIIEGVARLYSVACVYVTHK